MQDSLVILPIPDTVFALQKANDTVSTRFFVDHGKTTLNYHKKTTEEATPLWIHLSLFFWVAVVLFARQSYTMRLRQILVATFNPQHVKQLQREGNLLKQAFPILFLFLHAFVISLFAFRMLSIHFPRSFYFSSKEGFVLLYVLVVLLFFAKFIAIWFSGILFQTKAVSRPYLLDHVLFYITEALLLFPLLILYVYSGMQIFAYVALTVLFALWLFRLQRAVVIGLACTNFSRSYLFLYLCTLEVLPVLLLYKISIQYV